jgi:hypothetical protein
MSIIRLMGSMCAPRRIVRRALTLPKPAIRLLAGKKQHAFNREVKRGFSLYASF